MELIIIILFLLVVFLFYKVNLLQKHITVLSFSDKNINKLLVRKEIITPTEFDIVVNESIGDMYEGDGNKIIKAAKDLGIHVPEYMDDEKLEAYVKSQELKRKNAATPYSEF